MRFAYVSWGSILAGLFLIIIGFLWLLDMLGYIEFNICIIGPILLIIAGAGLILKHDWW